MIPIHHCIAQSVPEYPVSPVSLYQSTNLLKSAPTYRATSFAPFSSPYVCITYLLYAFIFIYYTTLYATMSSSAPSLVSPAH